MGVVYFIKLILCNSLINFPQFSSAFPENVWVFPSIFYFLFSFTSIFSLFVEVLFIYCLGLWLIDVL